VWDVINLERVVDKCGSTTAIIDMSNIVGRDGGVRNLDDVRARYELVMDFCARHKAFPIFVGKFKKIEQFLELVGERCLPASSVYLLPQPRETEDGDEIFKGENDDALMLELFARVSRRRGCCYVLSNDSFKSWTSLTSLPKSVNPEYRVCTDEGTYLCNLDGATVLEGVRTLGHKRINIPRSKGDCENESRRWSLGATESSGLKTDGCWSSYFRSKGSSTGSKEAEASVNFGGNSSACPAASSQEGGGAVKPVQKRIWENSRFHSRALGKEANVETGSNSSACPAPSQEPVSNSAARSVDTSLVFERDIPCWDYKCNDPECPYLHPSKKM
jgi:hypothetical protein